MFRHRRFIVPIESLLQANGNTDVVEQVHAVKADIHDAIFACRILALRLILKPNA
jgi:hypothetical protein